MSTILNTSSLMLSSFLSPEIHGMSHFSEISKWGRTGQTTCKTDHIQAEKLSEASVVKYLPTSVKAQSPLSRHASIRFK